MSFREVPFEDSSYRDLLAHGIDPSALKAALGEHRFGVTMREWEAEQGRTHAGTYLCPLCSRSTSLNGDANPRHGSQARVAVRSARSQLNLSGMLLPASQRPPRGSPLCRP